MISHLVIAAGRQLPAAASVNATLHAHHSNSIQHQGPELAGHATLQEGRDLGVGEGWGEELEGVGEADGRPARDEVAGGARLAGVPPVHAAQHLGERARLPRQAPPEPPHQRPLLRRQRPAHPFLAFSTGFIVLLLRGLAVHGSLIGLFYCFHRAAFAR